MKVEQVQHNGGTMAMIFYNHPIDPGVHFFTDDQSSLQVGKQRRFKGEIVKPHKHVAVKMERIETLQEVLYVERGKVEITFYGEDNKPLKNCVLGKGDMVLLSKGGHAFKFLEETEMIEIKQGPFDPQSVERLEIKT